MKIFELLGDFASNAEVVETDSLSKDWIIEGPSIHHKNLNFFSILLTKNQFGKRRLMIEQPEMALVGLLVAKHENETYLLLNCRCEPGLHNLCQLTTTIQSTPSNYLQKHGGNATPYIEYFLNDHAGGRTIHESEQFDWGDYYLRKIKKFKIVQVDHLFEVQKPHTWVKFSDFLESLSSNHLLTADLRSTSILLASALYSTSSEALDSSLNIDQKFEHESLDLELMKYSDFDLDLNNPNFQDDVGRSLVWVKFKSSIREVSEWEQPLLKIPNDLAVDLWVRSEGRLNFYGVQKKTQYGLAGLQLLFPASPIKQGDATKFEIISDVQISAEGGRFFQHGVDIKILSSASAQFESDVYWVTKDELLALTQISKITSLELRLAASLILNLEKQ